MASSVIASTVCRVFAAKAIVSSLSEDVGVVRLLSGCVMVASSLSEGVVGVSPLPRCVVIASLLSEYLAVVRSSLPEDVVVINSISEDDVMVSPLSGCFVVVSLVSVRITVLPVPNTSTAVLPAQKMYPLIDMLTG